MCPLETLYGAYPGYGCWRKPPDVHDSCEYSILIEQSCTPNKRWSSSLGLGVELTTPHVKERNLRIRNVAQGLGPGRILWNVEQME